MFQCPKCKCRVGISDLTFCPNGCEKTDLIKILQENNYGWISKDDCRKIISLIKENYHNNYLTFNLYSIIIFKWINS